MIDCLNSVLVMIHQEAQSLPDLGTFLLHLEQSERSNAPVVIVRILKVLELNFLRGVFKGLALNNVNPALGALLVTHRPSALSTAELPLRPLEALEAAGGAAHPGSQAGRVVPHDELQRLNVPDRHHEPPHLRPLLHHKGETEVLWPGDKTRQG